MQGRIPSKNIKSLFEIHFRAQGKTSDGRIVRQTTMRQTQCQGLKLYLKSYLFSNPQSL